MLCHHRSNVMHVWVLGMCVCACMWAYPTMSQLCVNYTALTLSGRSPTTLSVVSMASFVVCTVRHHSGLCTYPRAHLNVKISYSPLGKTVKMVIVNTQKYTQYSHNSRTLRENKVQGRWHLLEFVLLLQIAVAMASYAHVVASLFYVVYRYVYGLRWKWHLVWVTTWFLFGKCRWFFFSRWLDYSPSVMNMNKSRQSNVTAHAQKNKCMYTRMIVQRYSWSN